MQLFQKYFSSSPAIARVLPFVLFVGLTALQGEFGTESAYWFYLAKTVAGIWLICEMIAFVPEMRWAISWEAIVVAGIVILAWIGLDKFYPHLPAGKTIWNPNLQFGENSPLAWLFIVTRILGSALVVPPLEEVFYRSFLYRYVAKQKFLEVPLKQFLPLPFFATAIVFGFSHSQWLAGIICGAAFQWLVIRKNRLGDAMTAHAIVNLLLGIWVVWRGTWSLW